MLLAGVQVQPAIMQRHGRWRSDTWRQYIDTHDNPAVRLLATRTLPQQTANSSARGKPVGAGVLLLLFLASPLTLPSTGAESLRSVCLRSARQVRGSDPLAEW